MAAGLTVGVELVGDGLDERFFTTSRPWRGVAPLAERLEAAGVAYWVIGAERGEAADPAMVFLDASLVATVAARHTSSLGLVVAAAPHRDHPYNLARRLVSVDHAARGRVGWLALDFDHAIALNAATDVWTDAIPRPAHTADAVDAIRTLWRSWPLESIVGDRATGVFADTAEIRRAEVANDYAITGPLNVPGSVQGDLPIFQVHAGDDAATRNADVVIVEDEVAPSPGTTFVVRVRTVDGIDRTLDRIAHTPAAGVILRVAPHDIGPVLDEVLPHARRRGLLRADDGDTLRARLDVPVPAAPDLSHNAPAFVGAPHPGGRV